MKNDDEDQRLFREAMEGVKPLKTPRRVTHRRPSPPRAKHSRQNSQEILEQSLAGPKAPTEIGEEIAFRKPGISDVVFRRLRRGGYAIESEIDLHGLTAAEAARALRRFIVEAVDEGLGCVRIVHGRGLGSGSRGPVLKAQVDHSLRLWQEVLAFVTTQSRHGGSGAVYVLLGKPGRQR